MIQQQAPERSADGVFLHGALVRIEVSERSQSRRVASRPVKMLRNARAGRSARRQIVEDESRASAKEREHHGYRFINVRDRSDG